MPGIAAGCIYIYTHTHQHTHLRYICLYRRGEYDLLEHNPTLLLVCFAFVLISPRTAEGLKLEDVRGITLYYVARA